MIHSILSTLLQGLGEEVDSSAVNLYEEDKTVNMNFYPICPNPELTVGVGRHSDLTAITVLLQDDIGGLFVKVEDKGWIEIPPVQGALVINIGDTLEVSFLNSSLNKTCHAYYLGVVGCGTSQHFLLTKMQ